jgi:hypothetical protein
MASPKIDLLIEDIVSFLISEFATGKFIYIEIFQEFLRNLLLLRFRKKQLSIKYQVLTLVSAQLNSISPVLLISL